MFDRPLPVSTILTLVIVFSLTTGRASAQGTSECPSFVLQGGILECNAVGSPLSQLRMGTFIAGSEAAGETLARAIALEVATAPIGSSSGSFTFVLDPVSRIFTHRAGSYGPSFSERAQTIGKGSLSTGVNYLYRSYSELDGLRLRGFEVLRFNGGTLPVSSSLLGLDISTNTIAGFANYGVLDNFDVGIIVPYVSISVKGASSIFGPADDELQTVRLDASAQGLSDIALSGKFRLLTLRPSGSATDEVDGGLALGLTVRLPTGSTDDLIGLGVTRTQVSLFGSAPIGPISPHVNVGYEFWSSGFDIPKDFQGTSSITAKDQVHYSVGFESEVHPKVTLMLDVLGRYLRGAGQVGYQPFGFPQNFANVSGAEALVAVPEGVHSVLIAPGAKWNPGENVLMTFNVLISATKSGLRTELTPVIGLEWAP